ncbi:MAG: hypothetical protein MH321_08680 [Leptospiraceae bacterium]|nr:hypothetical protein [Leptospiraceae bacterium]
MIDSYIPGLVLGFHGTDKKIAEDVVMGKSNLKKSENKYDWLGNGIYFWEGNYSRALEYAIHLKNNNKRSKIKISNPSVIAAVIDLRNCLNLLNSENIQFLKLSHKLLHETIQNSGFPMPINKPIDNENDILLRNLDCAVIENLHAMREQEKLISFDSVRGYFREGKEIYPNAGFHEKNHIQICIRNPECILGYFLPK